MTKKQQQQLEVVKKIYDSLDHLGRIAIKKDYQPSNEEREMFGKIVHMVNNMNNWF